MTDFETHPAGTADLVARLRNAAGIDQMEYPYPMCDEAADRIEQLEAALADKRSNLEHWRQEVGKLHSRVATLTDQLTRANAATAAAFDVAAKAVAEAHVFADDDTDGETAAKVIALGRAGKAIRALATPDQTAALDRLIAEAVKPLLIAAKSGLRFIENTESELGIILGCGGSLRNAILAASKKGGA